MMLDEKISKNPAIKILLEKKIIISTVYLIVVVGNYRYPVNKVLSKSKKSATVNKALWDIPVHEV